MKGCWLKFCLGWLLCGCVWGVDAPREAVDALARMRVFEVDVCHFEVVTHHVRDRGALSVRRISDDVEVTIRLQQQQVQILGHAGKNLPLWRERIVPQHVVTPMDFFVMFMRGDKRYLGEQRIRARYAYVWSFEDSMARCSGKIWIDKHLFAPMRVEWSDDAGPRHKIDILSFKNTSRGWFVKTVEVSDEHDVVSKIRFFNE